MRENKRRVSARLLAVVALLASLLVSTMATGASADDRRDDRNERPAFALTILHNNDGESKLVGSDTEGGVARFKTLVKEERRDALKGPGPLRNRRGVILVSSGDNFLAGTAFTASLEDGTYYDAVALDSLDYDAIDLGNHDFDFGPDILADFIDDFRRPGKPPYLSANLDFSGEPALQELVDDGVIAKSTIVKERGRRIGIIGATTENLPFISSPREVVVNAVQPAVQAEIDRLERRGVKHIVLISHLQGIDGDIALAEQLSGVDVVIAGGGDELLANPDDLLLPSDQAQQDDPDEDDPVFGAYPQLAVNADGNTVPVVTTSGQYGYLGRLNVVFNRQGEVISWDGGPVRVVDKSVGSDGVSSDKRLLEKVVEPIVAFEAGLAATVIAQTEVELDGIRGNIRSVETNQGNLIADSQLWQAQQLAATFGVDSPQVALANGGGIRNDSIIAAGATPGAPADLTLLDTFDMVPFGNFVTVVPDVPRDQFKDIMENAVSRIQPTTLSGGTGRYAQVAGFTMVFDTAGTPIELDGDGNVTVAGSRIQELTLDDGTVVITGGAVVPGAPIDVAIVDFLARGGDQYPFRGAAFTPLGVSYQQALANYIEASAADGGLGGAITAADYPEGGEGRVTQIN